MLSLVVGICLNPCSLEKDYQWRACFKAMTIIYTAFFEKCHCHMDWCWFCFQGSLVQPPSPWRTLWRIAVTPCRLTSIFWMLTTGWQRSVSRSICRPTVNRCRPTYQSSGSKTTHNPSLAHAVQSVEYFSWPG